MFSADQIESVEKLTMRWLFQALLDFGPAAYTIFLNSPDEVKDIAEDITREALDRLVGFNIPERMYGTVDYKRARYVITPEYIVRQALFVDSKAEKENRSATIQMSQTSMHIRHIRAGKPTDEVGLLPSVSTYGHQSYLTTTAFLHFNYQDADNSHQLRELTLFCVPNGLLQMVYNPTIEDTFWLAGRNAPSLDEDFRVRVSFGRLRSKALWRVQTIAYQPNQVTGVWSE